MTEDTLVRATNLVQEARYDTYEQIHQKAQLVRQIFAQREIKIRNGSALDQVLRKADVLSKAWSAQGAVPDAAVFCEAAFVNRLADAVTALPDEAGIKTALERMAGSIMQSDNRQQSQGKDSLWEVILLAELRARGLAAIAAEPDILLKINGADYPIACKKIWSVDNMCKQISKGAHQVAPFNNGGIIALNLDDLVPPGHVVAQPTNVEAQRHLALCNAAFIDSNKHTLRRAVMEGAFDGYLISTTAPAIMEDEATSFSLCTASTLWYPADAPQERVERIIAFAQAHIA